ncbi:secreted RxLR effector protein 78-like [Phaseolus vulgaris]|uniref:secreted RxLR effector protein 78-like n=1 Tax=Phaseolus vulgaris TaxID=3885 RepID=UPI0035CC600E
MSNLIDSRQSAFLEGRGLLVSVLVANEVLEEVKRRKQRCVYFKVDYEKAYDSVSWEFLYYMLGRLGFCERWIRWIKSCLESSSVSVLVNGSPTSEFCPKRGLRQGDPLAPFLFLIVGEGLTGVVRKAVEKNLVESLEVGVKNVKVNMLHYADDTLFLCEANFKSVCNLKVILHCFELASGLKVNFSKSRIGGVGLIIL